MGAELNRSKSFFTPFLQPLDAGAMPRIAAQRGSFRRSHQPVVKVLRAASGDGRRCSLHVSPRGEAKCVRGPSGRGASRLARAGVLEPYVEHGKQAQRSPGGPIACFDRRVVRHAG